MMRGDEGGFTLVEMLVAMVSFMVLFSALVVISTTYLHDNTYDSYRDTTQDAARQAIDRISRDLRNAASTATNSAPTTGGLLEEATSSDIAFAEVNATGPTTNDLTNEMQVRYCLDSADKTLWRQTTNPNASYTTLPDTSACPSLSASWVQTGGGSPCCVVMGQSPYQATAGKPVYVVNESEAPEPPLFSFGSSGITSTTPLSSSQLAQINQLQVDLYADENPGGRPGPTEIKTGIYFRNDFSSPTAQFTSSFNPVSGSTTTRTITLNASASSDPNGQALTYQWYSAGTCSGGTISNGTPISGATSQVYTTTSTYTVGATYTFILGVTDTAGLTDCQSQQLTPS